MFCTIITYLEWFCCCAAYSKLADTENGKVGWEREKAFGKFNFIVFSWVNVWGGTSNCTRIFPRVNGRGLSENEVKNLFCANHRLTLGNFKFVYKSPRRAAKLKLTPNDATKTKDLKFIPSWILYRIMRVPCENEFTNYPWKKESEVREVFVHDMEPWISEKADIRTQNSFIMARCTFGWGGSNGCCCHLFVDSFWITLNILFDIPDTGFRQQNCLKKKRNS